MLSLPDFKNKQIVFVHACKDFQNNISFQNENLIWSKEGEAKNRISCHKILALFIIGDCTLTTVLIRKCQELGVSLFLLKDNLWPYAKLIVEAEGNYLLRQKQYSLKPEQELEIAKQIVLNKIYNQLTLLNSQEKVRSDLDDKTEQVRSKIQQSTTVQDLLGIEGAASAKFFKEYFASINWYKRMPRTKIDYNNLLLDIGYSILFNFIECLLSLYGFDLYKGVYHQLFFQRKSLVCDFEEPFRCLIDKQLVKSTNLKQIDKNDFIKSKGRYSLPFQNQKKYLKIFTEALFDRREEIFEYIHQYYFYILNDCKKEFPFFKI